MVTCEHDHDEGHDSQCGEPATHAGYVIGGIGKVVVCDRHRQVTVGLGVIHRVAPLPQEARP